MLRWRIELVFFILLFILFPVKALALTHPIALPTGGPMILQLQVGFSVNTRVGYWTPVQVLLGNSGADFVGMLSLRTYTGPHFGGVIGSESDWSVEDPVTLANKTQKNIAVFVPFRLSPADPLGVLATLSDTSGKIVATSTQTSYSIHTSDLFIGVLSDSQSGFGLLANVSLPNQTNSLTLAFLDAKTLPAMEAVLENFDVLLLDDFSTSTLNASQLTALETWVNFGGILIEVGGPEWQRTLSPLSPSLLPVVLPGTVGDTGGTTVVPNGTSLLLNGSAVQADAGQKSSTDNLPTPMTVSRATLRAGGDSTQSTQQGSIFAQEVVLSSSSVPLLVQARKGSGVIFYLAFDPTLQPFIGWAGAGSFWESLLLRALGDRVLVSNLSAMYDNGPGQLVTRGGIVALLYPDTKFAFWTIGLLLICYLLVLGPGRLWIMRRLRKPLWSWRIVLGSIVVFSLLSYGLAYYQKGTVLIDNSISIVQLNEGGSAAHITTYMGIFAPNAGDFQVHIPASAPDSEVLAQPVSNSLLSAAPDIGNEDLPTVITPGSDGMTMNLLSRGLWTFSALVAEQDRQLHGGIVPSLTLRNGSLVGTITNRLSTALSDVYVLMPHSFVSIGHLAAGGTQQVDVLLQVAQARTGTTLADAIAKSNGLPAGYSVAANGEPESEFQRHIALLSALSGAGSPSRLCNGACSLKGFVSKYAIMTPPVAVPGISLTNGLDPLLIPNTTATLVGWADSPLDTQGDVTINGSTPGGFHESFVQMPLDVSVSAPLNVPSDFIAGRMVDVQGTDVQAVQPGIYTMINGRLTFEFVLPLVEHGGISGLTIRVPNMLGSSAMQRNMNYVEARLYDWQTGRWDTIESKGQDSFVTGDVGAYIGPSGNVLLRVAKQGVSLETLVLGRPSLELK